MKTFILTIVIAALGLLPSVTRASQADDTTITITAQTPGATPFLSQLTLTASDTTVIKSIAFTITPRPRSVTRPLSGTYSRDYMIERGYLQSGSNDIFLPVYGLYDDYTNTVTLTYYFLDGSSKGDSTTITTPLFDDQGCGYKTPTILQARTPTTSLSYDYIFIRSGCGDFSPVILDTDRYVRWVSTLPATLALLASSTFHDGAAYVTQGPSLYRVDLDGMVTLLQDYSSIGVENLHHNIDPGKTGLLIEPDTTSYYESEILEVNPTDGTVIKTFNLADIISAAMIAGGDDPNQFVYPTPTDWFHNNAATYNRADDSLIVSSRENFVICLDYETATIKWIFGDTTKHWYEFPSLAQFALNTAADTLAPIGQHATSLTFDQGLLLFDDGFNSTFQQPPGLLRPYSSPRKYQIDLATTPGTATEVWNFEMNQSIDSPFCSSVYEDAPYNYLVDYAIVGGFGDPNPKAQLLGLNAAEEIIFYYEYPAMGCSVAYNSIPIHLENTSFPVVSPRALNLSARANISPGDNALIGGFIVTGTDNKDVAVRALGPSLSSSGLSGTLTDPVLTLFDSSGAIVATNDDWQTDSRSAELTADGLAPTDPVEAATIQTLAPGPYTAVVTGKDATPGIGLVEIYDLSTTSATQLGNLSARGNVGAGDDVLIAGFIVGDEGNSSVIIRGLGPSLGSAVSTPLADPTLTIFDANGTALATNNNWQDDIHMTEVSERGLAPTDAAEAAIALFPPAGSYSAILSGADGGSGIGLLEIYELDASSAPPPLR